MCTHWGYCIIWNINIATMMNKTHDKNKEAIFDHYITEPHKKIGNLR